jgi:hypothetical protein
MSLQLHAPPGGLQMHSPSAQIPCAFGNPKFEKRQVAPAGQMATQVPPLQVPSSPVDVVQMLASLAGASWHPDASEQMAVVQGFSVSAQTIGAPAPEQVKAPSQTPLVRHDCPPPHVVPAASGCWMQYPL